MRPDENRARAILGAVTQVVPAGHDVIVIAFPNHERGADRGKRVEASPPPAHFYTTNVRDRKRVVGWLRHVADGIERGA